MGIINFWRLFKSTFGNKNGSGIVRRIVQSPFLCCGKDDDGVGVTVLRRFQAFTALRAETYFGERREAADLRSRAVGFTERWNR